MTNRFQSILKAGLRARFFLVGGLAIVMGAAGCSRNAGFLAEVEPPPDPVAESDPDPVDASNIDRHLSRRIHAFISEMAQNQPREFSDYEITIPGVPGSPLSMVAIPAGEFTMGSPPSEPDRRDDEGPTHRVGISAFWMGQFEISWDLYNQFLEETKTGDRPIRDLKEFLTAKNSELADWVSGPTESYMEMSFGMGREGFPAICMTQHAASKFCEWLSARTGHFYRLPTEAEWEYACRAGSKTAYHFGDAPDLLGEFDFFDPEVTNTGYRKVAEGKPNPWGLYNMHGNVIEWCLDQYLPDAYAKRKATGDLVLDPLEMPVHRYPRVARGGSWYDEAKYCRSAARTFSNPDWIQQDPCLPQSLWWLSDAEWLGFRVVRPLKVPDSGKMYDLWNSGNVHHDPERKPPPKRS